MKKNRGLLIILALFILSCITLIYYFNNKHTYAADSIELTTSRIIFIVFFNLFFYALIFLLNIDYYIQIFKIVLIVIASIWIFELLTWAYLDLTPISLQYGTFWEVIILLSFSLIGQGLIIYIIYYIRKNTAKYSESKVFGRYHVHEGFIGILFIIIALFLFILRSSLLFLSDILWKRLSIILWLIQIFLFISLYLGSFLFFRDWHDVLRFKFIEKIKASNELSQKDKLSAFNRITQEDIHFYEFPKLIYYPFGILLTIFAVNALVYGTDFLPMEIFYLETESIIRLGYLICFIAGGMIGRDWLRLFRKVYPNLYEEIKIIISKLKK